MYMVPMVLCMYLKLLSRGCIQVPKPITNELIFQDFSCVLIFWYFRREIQMSKISTLSLDSLRPMNRFLRKFCIREPHFRFLDHFEVTGVNKKSFCFVKFEFPS